jgi:predicted nuclease with TOPRIM domain
MDYEPRIVKLEVTVEIVQGELTQLRTQVAALDHKLDRRSDELRDHVDRRFDELRNYVDRRFSEQHAEIVQLRPDFEKLICWVAGLTITNLLAIAGLALKAAGLY